MPTPPIVLAIDPGRAKCGLAVLDSAGAVLHRAIVPAADVGQRVLEIARALAPSTIVVGSGTGTEPVCDAVRALGLPAPVVCVDEGHTSEQARARFLAENPARGWQRLLPAGLRSPASPYDDYVAVILAERWLAPPEALPTEPDQAPPPRRKMPPRP